MNAKSVAMASIAVALMGVVCSCTVLRGGITRQTIASEYYAIAEAYSDLEKYDKAIPYYEEAAKQKEYRNAARYGLGRMYGLTGDWDTARDIFESLLKKDPNNEMLETAYSFSLVSSGKADEAIPLYRSVMELHPDDPVLARNFVEIQILAGKYDAALETIAAARTKFSDSDVMKEFDDLEAQATAAKEPPPEQIPTDSMPKEGQAKPVTGMDKFKAEKAKEEKAKEEKAAKTGDSSKN